MNDIRKGIYSPPNPEGIDLIDLASEALKYTKNKNITSVAIIYQAEGEKHFRVISQGEGMLQKALEPLTQELFELSKKGGNNG